MIAVVRRRNLYGVEHIKQEEGLRRINNKMNSSASTIYEVRFEQNILVVVVVVAERSRCLVSFVSLEICHDRPLNVKNHL
jgi:phosphoserine aminotransferase